VTADRQILFFLYPKVLFDSFPIINTHFCMYVCMHPWMDGWMDGT